MTASEKQTLASYYNASDIDALLYMKPFLEGNDELMRLWERVYYLNNETGIGWGYQEFSSAELDEYYKGKWELLKHFGIKMGPLGDAYVE